MLKLLEITKLMVYRDMNYKLKYNNKIIAEILAEFYLAYRKGFLEIDQIIKFIERYKVEM
jgi:hypothetical protein